MKVKDKAEAHFSDSTWQQAALSAWRQLGAPAVGGPELEAIQKEIANWAGPNQAPSPAKVARELAREGAELRHPEVIEFDARWRESQLENYQQQFTALGPLLQRETPALDEAEQAIVELEKLRMQFMPDKSALNDLRDVAIEARLFAVAQAADFDSPLPVRETQAEIAEWLRVWLETPGLFTQWLELRKVSRPFADKFGAANTR
ncbi:MAG TPA: hypothetical protein VE961_19175 [Pyrinomonadaceae bacterium]|nr:hypothetical protein [Pyrinomonadaceae bacterium]